MKAVLLREGGGPEKLTIEEVPTPEPGPGEVRVNLNTSAVNRRDVWLTMGMYPNLELPCIPGSDGAGTVDAIGENVNQNLLGREVVIYPAFDWGDDPHAGGPDFRVLGMPDPGTFAEFICVPATNVYPRPVHLSWQEAAAVPLAGLTAWRAVVTQAAAQAGQTILVTGAGSGVSTFAIQWAARHDASVYVTSSHDDKIKCAVKLGAEAGVIYNDTDWGDQLRNMAGGFDAVIDSAGGDNFMTCLDLLNPGGRLVFFGATLGNPTQPLNLRRMFWPQLRIQGTSMGSPAEFKAMLAFMNDHELHPQVDLTMPISQVVTAFQRVLNFNQTGKIVLKNDSWS